MKWRDKRSKVKCDIREKKAKKKMTGVIHALAHTLKRKWKI